MNTPVIIHSAPLRCQALLLVWAMISLVSGAGAQPVAPSAKSLVHDAGFEHSSTSTLNGIWSSDANATLEVEQYYLAKSGSKYLEVNGSPGNVDVQVEIGAYTTDSGNHALMHGRSYYLGVWVGVANTNDQRAILQVQRKNQAGNYYVDFEKSLSFTGTGNANQTIGWHYLRGVYHFEDNEGMMDDQDPATVRLSLRVDNTSVFFVDQVEVYELYPDSIKGGPSVIDDPGFAAGALRTIATNSYWGSVAGYFELNPGNIATEAPNDFRSDGNGLYCANTFLGLNRYITYAPNLQSSPEDWRYYVTTVEMKWLTTKGKGGYEVLVRGGAYKLAINATSGYAQLKSISGKVTTLDYAGGVNFSAGIDYTIVFSLAAKTVGGKTYDDITVTVSDSSSTLLTLEFDASDEGFSQFEYLGNPDGGGVSLAVSGAATAYTKSLKIEDAGGDYDSWNFTDVPGDWESDWIPGALSTTSSPESALVALLDFDPSMKIIYAYQLGGTTVGNAVPIGTSQAEIDMRASVKTNIFAFLDALGDKISIYAVDNEPLWTFPLNQHTTTRAGDDYVRSVEWMKIVAGWVHEWRTGTGGNPDLKIGTGAIIFDRSLYEDLTPDTSDKFLILAEEMIRWANEDPNIDYIDVHLFPVDQEELVNSLAWLRMRVQKPMICTEWSQQGGSAKFIYNPGDTNANATKLLDATFRNNSVLYTAGLIGLNATNADYVQAAYKNPVPKAEFDAFVQLALNAGDIDTGFIQAGFDSFNRAGLVFPCYAIHNQYSDASSLTDLQTSFNMLQLWGNLSIQGIPVSGAANELEYQPIAGFRDQWQAASSRILPDGLLVEHHFEGTGHSLQTAGTGGDTVAGGQLNIDAMSGSFNGWDNTIASETMRVEAVLSLNSYNSSNSGIGIFAKRDPYSGDRYALVYRIHTGQVALSVTDGGITTDLGAQSYAGLLSHPAHFLLEVAEPVIRGYIDHQLVFEVTDSTHAGQSGAGGFYGWGADFDVDAVKIHQGRALEKIDSGVSTDYSWSNYLNGSWSINSDGQFEQGSPNVGLAVRVADWVGAQTDYCLSATVTPLDIHYGGSVGLFTRYDPVDKSRYEFAYQPGAKRLALRRCNDSGVQTLLRTMDMTGREPVNGHDYEMAIEVVGQRVRAYWEGFLVFSYYDETPGGVTSGRPGFHTYLCRGAFDNVRVETR